MRALRRISVRRTTQLREFMIRNTDETPKADSKPKDLHMG